MGSNRTKEKGKAPLNANHISPNTDPYRGITFFQGNVDEDDFDSNFDRHLSISDWDNIHRSVVQGVPEPIPNLGGISMNPNYLQNPQTNLSCDVGGESSYRSVTGSSSLFSPRDIEPVHARNNVKFTANQSGVQEKFVSDFQLDGREIKMARDCKAAGQTFNKGFESHGSLNHDPGCNKRHTLHRQHHDRRFVRAGKLKEAAPPHFKTVRARKPTYETLDADFRCFQRYDGGFYNQFSNVDGMASTNYEAGVHSTFDSGSGSSRQTILRRQENNGGNVRFGDMHQSSRMTFNYEPSERIKRLRTATFNSPSYAGQSTSQNDIPTQVLGGTLSSQWTETPQMSWIGRGLASINALFSKRLRNNPQSPKGHQFPMETSLQTINSGLSDGAFVSYPVSQQEPIFNYGQSQNDLIQLPRGHPGAQSTNASSVHSQSRKCDSLVRPHHKRSVGAPPSTSQWVQNKKRVHPTDHHSVPKPHKLVTTGHIHPSIPGGSRASNVRPRVHVTSAPFSRITWKDPDATFKLSGYKCFLCKKDVGLTSDGAVYQPMVPPPVAVLPCGHTFHDKCLQNITPDDQAKDPPCISCAIGEN